MRQNEVKPLPAKAQDARRAQIAVCLGVKHRSFAQDLRRSRLLAALLPLHEVPSAAVGNGVGSVANSMR